MDKLYSFSIGDLASRAGVSVQAVRHYERRGLLKPAFRKANGYRAYVPESVLRLGFIRQAQSLGFSLSPKSGSCWLWGAGNGIPS